MESLPNIQFAEGFHWDEGRDTVFRICRVVVSEREAYSLRVHISMEALKDYDDSISLDKEALLDLTSRIWDGVLYPIFRDKLRRAEFDKENGVLFILSEDVNG